MITLTEAAAGKVKALLAEEGRDDIALRVAVQPGGCSGLRYAMYLDDQVSEKDATQEQFVYSHRWTQHDLVIWDNRATMHRVRRYDDLNTVRDLRRTTTKSDGPTVAQEAA